MRDRAAAAALLYVLLAMWAGVVVVAGLAVGGVDAHHQSVPTGVLAATVVVAMGTTVPMARWLRPQVEAVLWSHPDGAPRVPVAPVEGDDLAGEIAAQIAARLRLPYVAVLGPDDEPAGTVDPARLVRIPLVFADEPMGQLVVAPRSRDRTLAVPDLALLTDLAAQISIAMHADRAREAVQRSRAEVITAREEERRRIRRDLHDGLAPSLASLGLHLAALRQLLASDPPAAATLVDRLRDDVRTTSGLVRELVYDLRPTLLDDVGLRRALRSRVEQLEDRGGTTVALSVDDALPTLSAAVEVAVYRIACEALGNVERHAHARHCDVSLELAGDRVLLAVRDDGRGLPEGLLAGVGLAGIRERAEELAGEVVLGPGLQGRGTGVLVRLPARQRS